MSKSISFYTLFLVLLLFNQGAIAQKPWEKDWKTLKSNEVDKILNDSPWAKNYNDINISIEYGTYNQILGAGLVPAGPLIIRFYSSLKIRQALLRNRHFYDGYDKLSAEQKQRYDEATKDRLECPKCAEFYVFVIQDPVTGVGEKSVVSVDFKSEKVESLKDKVFLLNDSKEKRVLGAFAAPSNDTAPAVFYFPKLDANGKPLITKDTKKIILNFKTSLFDRKGGYLKDVTFDVTKMFLNGELDF